MKCDIKVGELTKAVKLKLCFLCAKKLVKLNKLVLKQMLHSNFSNWQNECPIATAS